MESLNTATPPSGEQVGNVAPALVREKPVDVGGGMWGAGYFHSIVIPRQDSQSASYRSITACAGGPALDAPDAGSAHVLINLGY